MLGTTLFGLLEVLPDQPVLSPTRASKAIVQSTTTLAHPPYLPGRHPGHQSIILYVFRNNGTGGNQSAAPYRMTAHYRAIRAKGGPLAHARTRVNSVHREVRPRSIYIRENAGRPTEDIVFKLNAFVDGNIVLDPDTIPNADIVTYIHILAQGTILTYDSPSLDMAEMPNFRSGANLDAVIHVAALVNEIVLHSPFPMNLFYPIIAEANDPGYDGFLSSLPTVIYSLMEVIIVQRLSSFML